MAFGSPAAERAAIESTYEDTATVYRTAPKRGANCLSASVPYVVYSGIICALSYSGTNSSMQTNAHITSCVSLYLETNNVTVLLFYFNPDHISTT